MLQHGGSGHRQQQRQQSEKTPTRMLWLLIHRRRPPLRRPPSTRLLMINGHRRPITSGRLVSIGRKGRREKKGQSWTWSPDGYTAGRLDAGRPGTSNPRESLIDTDASGAVVQPLTGPRMNVGGCAEWRHRWLRLSTNGSGPSGGSYRLSRPLCRLLISAGNECAIGEGADCRPDGGR
jgi:hypothetical protein